jgi:hypothetical protein
MVGDRKKREQDAKNERNKAIKEAGGKKAFKQQFESEKVNEWGTTAQIKEKVPEPVVLKSILKKSGVENKGPKKHVQLNEEKNTTHFIPTKEQQQLDERNRVFDDIIANNTTFIRDGNHFITGNSTQKQPEQSLTKDDIANIVINSYFEAQEREYGVIAQFGAFANILKSDPQLKQSHNGFDNKDLRKAFDDIDKCAQKFGKDDILGEFKKEDNFFMKLINKIAAVLGIETKGTAKEGVKSFVDKIAENKQQKNQIQM